MHDALQSRATDQPHGVSAGPKTGFRAAFALPVDDIPSANSSAAKDLDNALLNVVIDYRRSRFLQGKSRYHALLRECDLDRNEPLLSQIDRLTPQTAPLLLFEILNFWFDKELPSESVLWRYLDKISLFDPDDTLCHGLLYNFLVVPLIRHTHLAGAEELAKLALSAYEQIGAGYLQAFMHLHLAIIRIHQADLAEALIRLQSARQLFECFGKSRWEIATVDAFAMWISVEQSGRFPALEQIEKTGDDLMAGGFWPEAFLALATVHIRALREDNTERALARLPALETVVRARGMTQILPALQLLRGELLGLSALSEQISLPEDQLHLLMPGTRMMQLVEIEAEQPAMIRQKLVRNLGQAAQLLRESQFDLAAPIYIETLDRIEQLGLINVLKSEQADVMEFLTQCRARKRFVEKARHYRNSLLADLVGAKPVSIHPAELTESEYGVLRRLPLSTSNKALARDLDVTEATVKFHLKKIYRKLGVHKRRDAITAAAAKGWIDPLS